MVFVPESFQEDRSDNKLTTIMIAFTEKFTHLSEIARGYTLIVTGNVVLGLASSEDLSEV